MSGAAEWASERNLRLEDGYTKSFQKMWLSANWFIDQGIKTVSYLALRKDFLENNREAGASALRIFRESLEGQISDLPKTKYQIKFLGAIEDLPGNLSDLCHELEDKTVGSSLPLVNIAVNYSGRQEIIDTIKKILNNKISVDLIHEGYLRKIISSNDLPDVDLIINTAGERTVSGFLSWHSIHSRILFLNKEWPEFEEHDAVNICKT
jgi:undecaprenyl diphosphate synthase